MYLARPLRHSLALAISLALTAAAHAAPSGTGAGAPAVLDRLNVVGSADKAAESGGTAHYLSAEELDKLDYADVQRVLRQLPGVYLVDEEGFGLRPNIGIRGSGTDRNSRITVMEDGVLIAPAPYAAPSAYYFPTMARINAVEVRKGSSAVRSGPRTTGGVINLLSTPIPDQLSGQLEYAFGTDQTSLTHAHVGGRSNQFGFLFETAQQNTDGFKRIDGGGDSGYTLEDYMGKIGWNSDPNASHYQEFELKLGKVEQDSDETYLGLTDADFAAHPNRRYAASRLDNIQTDHEQIELRHRIELAPGVDLTTVLYNNEFARNWYKLNSVGGRSLGTVLENPVTFANEYSWLTGANSPDNALVLRNNNREYYSRGVQAVLGWNFENGDVQHAVEASLRLHEDEESRFQDDDKYRMSNGSLVLTSNGAPGTQDNRVGAAEALSFYLQDEIRFGSWIVTPGLRYEDIDLTRTNYVRNAGGRSQTPTAVIKSSVDEWIPGLGVTYLVNDELNVFASLHKGFNPPGPGANAKSEESINSELGVRYGHEALNGELVAFWNGYDNLVGTCTASTGGNCTIGDQFDGGEATVKGLELSGSYDLAHGRGLSVALPVQLAYTYTDATFDSSFNSSFEEWMSVQAGDRLPYLPEQQWHLSFGVEGEVWRVNLVANYLDEMRTRASQGAVPASQRTDDAWVLDLAAAYQLTERTELFARVENATDEDYVVSRRPEGARPGRSRASFLGIRVGF